MVNTNLMDDNNEHYHTIRNQYNSNELDDNGLVEGCPIICPFCRTKDYKIFYGNQFPYDIKSVKYCIVI